MPKNKTNKTITAIHYFAASTLLALCLPAYSEENDTKPVENTKISTKATAEHDKNLKADAKAKCESDKDTEKYTKAEAESESDKNLKADAKAEFQPDNKEVKQSLVATSTPHVKKKQSRTVKKISRTKAANEAMSSDDTTSEYINSVDPVKHYEKARQLALAEKYPAALREINLALAENPKYYEAQYLGALIYERQGRKKEAISKYKSLLFEKPNYLQALISYASLLADLEQNKAAEAEFHKAIEICFMSCEAHYNLANLLTRENRFKEALSELRICLKLKPDNAAVHNNLGVIYYHQNRKDAAEKEFQQASELDPASNVYLRNLNLVRTGLMSEEPSLG